MFSDEEISYLESQRLARIDAFTIAEILGHQDLRMTKRCTRRTSGRRWRWSGWLPTRRWLLKRKNGTPGDLPQVVDLESGAEETRTPGLVNASQPPKIPTTSQYMAN